MSAPISRQKRQRPYLKSGVYTRKKAVQTLGSRALAVRTKLLDSVDSYVLSMPSAVNRQRRCLHPMVRERQALVNQLQTILPTSAWSAARSPVADLVLLLGAADGGDALAA